MRRGAGGHRGHEGCAERVCNATRLRWAVTWRGWPELQAPRREVARVHRHPAGRREQTAIEMRWMSRQAPAMRRAVPERMQNEIIMIDFPRTCAPLPEPAAAETSVGSASRSVDPSTTSPRCVGTPPQYLSDDDKQRQVGRPARTVLDNKC